MNLLEQLNEFDAASESNLPKLEVQSNQDLKINENRATTKRSHSSDSNMSLDDSSGKTSSHKKSSHKKKKKKSKKKRDHSESKDQK